MDTIEHRGLKQGSVMKMPLTTIFVILTFSMIAGASDSVVGVGKLDSFSAFGKNSSTIRFTGRWIVAPQEIGLVSTRDCPILLSVMFEDEGQRKTFLDGLYSLLDKRVKIAFTHLVATRGGSPRIKIPPSELTIQKE